MTLSVLRVVSDITPSRTTSVNLNDGNPFYIAADIDWGTEDLLERSVATRASGDGGTVTAAALGMREPVIPLTVVAGTRAAAAAAIQPLIRALNEPVSFLEWQPRGVAEPVFFRVHRSVPQIGDPMTNGDGQSVVSVTLNLLTDPAAVGLAHTPVTAADLNNDPAATANGLFVDVTGVVGDLPAPAVLKFADTSGDAMLLTVAVRSRGNPSGVRFFRQAESIIAAGADVTSAAVSGFSGGSGARVGFTTNNLTTARLFDFNLIGNEDSPEVPGLYRVMAVVKRNGGADTDDFAFKVSLGGTLGPTVNVANLTAVRQLVDLGLYELAWPPMREGYGAQILADSDFALYVQRTSGTATSVDVDYVLAIPADTSFCTADFGTPASTTDTAWLDGPNDEEYTRAASGALRSLNVNRHGGLPSLVPGRTNRLYVLRSRSAAAYAGDSAFSAENVLADDLDITVSYHPHYLNVASS